MEGKTKGKVKSVGLGEERVKRCCVGKFGLDLVLILLKSSSKRMQESIYLCEFFEEKWSRREAADVLLRHSRKGGEGPGLELSHPGTASKKGRSRDGGAALSCSVMEGS